MMMEHRWLELLPECPAVDARAAFRRLGRDYSASCRHYHTLRHIEDLLRLSAVEHDLWVDRRSVDLAIFFHDAVYDVHRDDNEIESARLATSVLVGLGVGVQTCRRVAGMIEATAHFSDNPVLVDADAARMVDIDLAILAADTAIYDAYSSAVRLEYAHLSDDEWRKGRARVLKHFIGAQSLYAMPDHADWQHRAHENMRRELALIGGSST